MRFLLTELDAEFLRWEKRNEGSPDIAPAGGKFGDPYEHVVHVPVESIDQAHGVAFLCPLCFERNSGKRGTHMVICWSRSAGVPEEAVPGPGRWKMEGTGLADLTLNADPPSTARSVLLTSGCGWHGHVTGGAAE